MSYPKGKPKSEESKRKASESCKALWTDEKKLSQKIKYSGKNNPFYGKKHGEEVKKVLRESRGKQVFLKESFEKISKSLIGNKRALGNKFSLTNEQKQAISLRNSGLVRTEECKKKISLSKKGSPSPMLGKRHSDETKRKLSVARLGKPNFKLRGENSPNWKGGISSENLKIRQSIDYKQWRRRVYERDKYTCQICGQIGGILNADHIKSFSKYPDLRLELTNGRTLCKDCHKNTPNYGRKSLKIKN